MTVSNDIQARIDHEEERIRNLKDTLPHLQERLRIAQAHADETEASHLLAEAGENVMKNQSVATEADLQRAKRAERERRQAVETAERELRLSQLLRDQLAGALETVQKNDIDGQLAELEKRLPKIAKKLADAWLAFEKVASEADEVKNEQRRLKALVPLKGVPVSLSRPVPTIPALEQIRRKHPRDSQRHPASALRRLGYEDFAEKVTPS